MEEKTQWGKDPDHGFIWNTIDHLLYWREHREKHCVSRKKYMRLCILGAFGAHQFYAKRPVLGLLYLATFWSRYDHRGLHHCRAHETGRKRQHLAVKSPLAACWAGKENTLWIMSCSFCSTPTTSSPASWSGSC